MAFKFTDENIQEIIESGKPVMVDFWATWCGPCMGMAPIIDELAKQFADRMVIGKYNVDEEGVFATEQRVMALPTIVFFKDGKRVERLAGSQTRETLVQKIESLLS